MPVVDGWCEKDKVRQGDNGSGFSIDLSCDSQDTKRSAVRQNRNSLGADTDEMRYRAFWLRSTLLVTGSVGLATLLTFPFRYATVHNQGLFLIAAVMLSARYGGFVPGLASAVLATTAFDWFFDQSP